MFVKTIEHYLEIKSIAHSNSCTPFYQAMSTGQRLNYNPRVIKPSFSDFLCDVELVAKGVLNEEQFRLFRVLYLWQMFPEMLPFKTDKMRKKDKKIKEQVGKALVAFKVYPIQRYFEKRDLR